MIYEEYNLYKIKYQAAYNEYDKILNEKEKLFIRTQPKSVNLGKELVDGGKTVNAFEEYLIRKEKEKIDERLEEALSILKDREMLLKLKKEELYQSKDWYDIAYIYKYIDNLSVEKIKYKMPYCRSQIYEILKKIRKNLSSDKIGQNV